MKRLVKHIKRMIKRRRDRRKHRLDRVQIARLGIQIAFGMLMCGIGVSLIGSAVLLGTSLPVAVAIDFAGSLLIVNAVWRLLKHLGLPGWLSLVEFHHMVTIV